MDSSPLENPCSAKQIFDRPSKVDHKDADGKGCSVMSEVTTMETLPTLSDWPNLEDVHVWHDKDILPDYMDDIDEIDAYEHFLASECGSDEGRRCDISYTDFCDDLVSDAFRNGWNDPLFSELPPEPIALKECSFPKSLSQKDQVGSMIHKGFWEFSNRRDDDDDVEQYMVQFCNRRLKMTKAKQDEEKDLEVQYLAKFSILTQIAQHADQAHDPFMPNSKGFGWQASAGLGLGRQVSASVDDLNFDHSFGQVTAPLLLHSRPLTLKQAPVDLAVIDEAVEIDAFAGPPGRALRKIGRKVADGKWCNIMSSVTSTDTLPTVSDWPRFSDILAMNNLDDGHGWHDKDPLLDDMDDMDKVDTYENFLASECSSHEGRRCDISYNDLCDRFIDPFRNGWNDPLFSELPPEPVAPKKCSFPKSLSQKDEVGKVQKPLWRLSTRRDDEDVEHHMVQFFNRRLKMTKAKRDEEKDLEVQYLAKFSILTQIAQHADQAQDPFMPNSKGFGWQVSAGLSLGRPVIASVDDLNFDHSFGQVTAPLLLPSRPLTLKQAPVDLAVVDEAVGIDAFAGPPGRALRKRAQHADQAREPFARLDVRLEEFSSAVVGGP